MKEKILNTILTAVTIICSIVFVIFIAKFAEIINDCRCPQLPVNEYYQDENCYKENEQKEIYGKMVV